MGGKETRTGARGAGMDGNEKQEWVERKLQLATRKQEYVEWKQELRGEETSKGGKEIRVSGKTLQWMERERWKEN